MNKKILLLPLLLLLTGCESSSASIPNNSEQSKKIDYSKFKDNKYYSFFKNRKYNYEGSYTVKFDQSDYYSVVLENEEKVNEFRHFISYYDLYNCHYFTFIDGKLTNYCIEYEINDESTLGTIFIEVEELNEQFEVVYSDGRYYAIGWYLGYEILITDEFFALGEEYSGLTLKYLENNEYEILDLKTLVDDFVANGFNIELSYDH